MSFVLKDWMEPIELIFHSGAKNMFSASLNHNPENTQQPQDISCEALFWERSKLPGCGEHLNEED
jgi:hypothetical protein